MHVYVLSQHVPLTFMTYTEIIHTFLSVTIPHLKKKKLQNVMSSLLPLRIQFFSSTLSTLIYCHSSVSTTVTMITAVYAIFSKDNFVILNLFFFFLFVSKTGCE